MVDETITQEPIVDNEPTQVLQDTPPETIISPAEPVVEEKTYVYQPTDEQGRPMGGKQVLKYRTDGELVQKMQEQNILLIRKLRQQTRNNRLGIPDADDVIPETAPRISEEIEFKPRKLSDDERVMLSRDLLDPDRVDAATDILFETKLGITPERLRTELEEQRIDRIATRAKQEVALFIAANPDYVVCADNSVALTNWMTKRNLSPVQENFQLAFDTLRKAQILVERVPEEPTTIVAEPATVELPVLEQAPSQSTVPGIGSGLTRDGSSNSGTPRPTGSDIVYEVVHPITKEKRTFTGLAAVEAMPSEEYKRRINRDPSFAAKVEKLENEAAARRRR